MFGNKNSRQQQQHEENQQQLIQQAQNQGQGQPPLVQYKNQDVNKKIEDLEANMNLYLKEVMGAVKDVAARIQAIEENKTPQMNAFTEQKRLSVIEQNLNQYNLQFNGILDFIKNQETQINSIMNLFYQLFPKKMGELERKAAGEEILKAKKHKKTRSEREEEEAEKAKLAEIEESELF